MNSSELIQALEAERDKNWRIYHTENFVVFSRRQVLVSGRANEPIKGITGRVKDAPLAAGFHGLPEEAWEDVCKLVTHVDEIMFTDRAYRNRKSLKQVPILIWDAAFPRPLTDEPSGVKRVSKADVLAPDPETIPNENASASSDAADYFVLIPVPNRFYWGELRPEWLCGAIAHELSHVWSSWAGPAKLATFLSHNPWRVVDEMLAVWAERFWTYGSRSCLDYAAEWTLQTGVSLYGAETQVEPFLCNCCYGYFQWPFIAWLESKCAGVAEKWLQEGSTNRHCDPWECLEKLLHRDYKGASLGALYAQYAGESFTSGFLNEQFTSNDARWYLKSVEEVIDIGSRKASLSIKGTLLPLSKRAFLVRDSGNYGRKWLARLKVPGKRLGFGLHLVQEDGFGRRKAVLSSSDTVPPCDLELPAAENVILVIFCSTLNEARQRPLGHAQEISASEFELVLEPEPH